MGRFTIEVTINRPPAEVFAWVGDPTTMPRWYDAVERVTPLTIGAVATGARFEIERSLPGGRVRNDVEITEYVRDRRITLVSRAGPTPFCYRYTLTPSATGTVLLLDGAIDATGLPGPMAHFDSVATQLFKRGMKQNLESLDELVHIA